jgi:hypothetical protein
MVMNQMGGTAASRMAEFTLEAVIQNGQIRSDLAA